MKIGFILKDIGLSQIDMRHPEEGNPGIGGSEFLFLLLMKYLGEYKEKFAIFCYHFEQNSLMEGICTRTVNDLPEVLQVAQEDQIDYLVYQLNWGTEWYSMLEKTEIKAVVWAHCYISKEELNDIADCENVKRVVFVGKEQYDTYIDHRVIEKAAYIYNMVPMTGKEERNSKLGKTVTYVGSLTKGKGFHLLAKEWRYILARVPEAELYIAGSGKLYDRRSRLGKYQIAEASYEASFMKYLTDDEGAVLSSVHFLGIVGSEKDELYRKTFVGVINPSAKTETFGMSAVEMSAYGIPIATKGQYGLYDTVLHKQTGLLSHTGMGLRRNIIRLLKDKSYNNQLGRQGKAFASAEFTPQTIVPEWIVLFEQLAESRPAVYEKPSAHYGNDFKWVRICNRCFKGILKLPRFPAVCDIKRTY